MFQICVSGYIETCITNLNGVILSLPTKKHLSKKQPTNRKEKPKWNYGNTIPSSCFYLQAWKQSKDKSIFYVYTLL